VPIPGRAKTQSASFQTKLAQFDAILAAPVHERKKGHIGMKLSRRIKVSW
jgi:hypothetical protein